ncbi:hypothetical protein KY284_004920 [Solanum tuberosum]|nr:hypothetical protein KY284_004920 [Solanum tuberosum]
MGRMGLRPNLITVLALCDMFVLIHEYSIRNDIGPDQQLRSGLIEAYGHYMCLNKAYLVFLSMRNRDVVAWSSLISAYMFQGKAKTALNIFEQMEKANVRLDGITSLGILKACSHAGLPDEAQK